MILSLSRRTDIPAFYTEWFVNRLKEGYAYYKNPFDRNQLYKVNLNKENIDLIVFWTKNPSNFLKYIDFFDDYNYYFQFTLTSYGQDIEKNLPKKKKIIENFIILSNKIGKERVVWRYDPIIITDYYTQDYHYKYFDKLCEKLSNYCNYVTISFLDFYKNTNNNCNHLKIKKLSLTEKENIALTLRAIGNKYNLKLKICSQDISKEIEKASCIDKNLIKSIFGLSFNLPLDKNQRKGCSCLKSIDLGVYSSCANFCSYCYANKSEVEVRNNITKYNPSSPILLNQVEDWYNIKELKIKSNTELTLF